MLCIFLRDYDVRLEGIKLKKYLGYLFFDAFFKMAQLIAPISNSQDLQTYFVMPFNLLVYQLKLGTCYIEQIPFCHGRNYEKIDLIEHIQNQASEKHVK